MEYLTKKIEFIEYLNRIPPRVYCGDMATMSLVSRAAVPTLGKRRVEVVSPPIGFLCSRERVLEV